MIQAAGHAQWFAHINHINPPQNLRHWLTDRTSLTAKLIARSSRFRVQRLRQQHGKCLHDEHAEVDLPRLMVVREREVLLRCDEQPVVFAHTVVPLSANASDWPFFGGLGERSLGTTLFGDPKVSRGPLQFARLQASHLLARRAMATLAMDDCRFPLYARRCLFQRNKGLLLVTEVFLPGISSI